MEALRNKQKPQWVAKPIDAATPWLSRLQLCSFSADLTQVKEKEEA